MGHPRGHSGGAEGPQGGFLSVQAQVAGPHHPAGLPGQRHTDQQGGNAGQRGPQPFQLGQAGGSQLPAAALHHGPGHGGGAAGPFHHAGHGNAPPGAQAAHRLRVAADVSEIYDQAGHRPPPGNKKMV